MTSFEESFGSDFGGDRSESLWDKPFFDNRSLEPNLRFVAWVDLMGAANHMLLSLPKAACFIGKIHDAGLQGKIRHPSISIHPIADGFYAIGGNWQEISSYTSRVMRSLAYCFEKEQKNDYRFLVRAGIAYGRFIDGHQMSCGSDTFRTNDAYLRNVIAGSPLSWAYKAEGKSPPFGIYVDQSVTEHAGERVGWVLHKWWKDDQKGSAWASSFGSQVRDYLEWLNQNRIGMRYPFEKHDSYMTATAEYFKT
jgi:hypothetical protein